MTWRVELSHLSRSSLIVGGEGALGLLAERMQAAADAGRRVFVVSDEVVWAAVGHRFADMPSDAVVAASRLVPAGETSKSVAAALGCWEWLTGAGARRDDVVMAVGGGVVGDLAGFVAATYLRGIALWQVPTTLLAQVDSSVGGKVAVNLPAGKNLVGSFYQPELVVADPTLLASLPDPEYRSGMGEVVKYGLLDRDGLLGYLETNVTAVAERRPDVVDAIVHHCIALKAAVVSEDETDRGGRAVLNLGHTVAHALEATAGYGAMSHGVAVGLGLLVALAVSEEVVGLAPAVRETTRRLLETLGLPVTMPSVSCDEVLVATGRDKKVSASGSGFVCLRSVGEPVWGVAVGSDALRRGLEAIRP